MASIAQGLGFFCFFIAVFLRFPSIQCVTPYDEIVEYKEEYSLPDLPYGYDGLEPFIDEATLRVHHMGHHAAYTKKLNAALNSWRESVSIVLRWSRVLIKYTGSISTNGRGDIAYKT